MNSTKVVTAYSKSLFQNVIKATSGASSKTQLFEVGNITAGDKKAFLPTVYIVGEELLLLRSTLISSKKLKEYFKNPTYPEQQKFEVLCNIFPGLTITMKAFLKVLTERSHLSLIPAISDEYNGILLKFKQSTNVKLITASALQEGYGTLLLTTLRKLTSSKDVVLNVSYNPKLLGGIMVEYGSTLIDASTLKEFSLFFNDV